MSINKRALDLSGLLKSVGTYASASPGLASAAGHGAVGAGMGAITGGAQGALMGGIGGAASGGMMHGLSKLTPQAGAQTQAQPQAQAPQAKKVKTPKPQSESKEASMSMSAQEQVFFDTVYVPALIEKCASYGVDIPDADSLNAALDIAALVKAKTQKMASSTIKQAAAELRGAMGVVSQEVEQQNTYFDKRAEEAGEVLSTLPELQAAFAEMNG